MLPAHLLAIAAPVILWLTMVSFTIHAQPVFEKPVILTHENGLPPAEIRCIRKGGDGFIWIGTTNGLCRFDGKLFKTFSSTPGSTRSLLSNSILDVAATETDVWVGTARGLSRIDVAKDTYEHHHFNAEGSVTADSLRVNQGVTSVHLDGRGNVYVGTRAFGVFYLDTVSGRFESFKQDGDFQNDLILKENAHAILTLTADPVNDSLLYAGAYAGLWIINTVTHKASWHFYPDADAEVQTRKNTFKRMHAHDDGFLYYGGWGGGIYRFDLRRKRFDPALIGGPVATGSVVSILRKSHREIFITTTQGLVVYDTEKEVALTTKENEPVNNRYYGATMIDEANRAWLHTFEALYIFDPVVQQFSRYPYGSALHGWSFAFYVHEYSPAELIVVPRHENNIYHFDRLSGRMQKVPVPQGMHPFVARGLSAAPDGTLTISSDRGLFTYHPGNRSLTPFPFRPSLKFGRYRDVLWDRSGHLWLAAEFDGLLKYNPVTRAVRLFDQELHPPDVEMTIAQLGPLVEDDHGNIWFGRNNGLGVYIKTADSIVNFIYAQGSARSFNEVFGTAVDNGGRIWFSDRDGQVGFAYAARPDGGIVRKLNLRKKYGIEFLYNIAFDGDRYLWGYSEHALVRIDVENLDVSQFTFQYGLMSGDFYCIEVLQNGSLLLGGRNSIVLSHPSGLTPNPELPEPYFTEVEVLQHPEAIAASMELKHWQNSFAFGFSAKAFTLGKASRFRYRLTNFDDDWIEAEERRFANYTNIPAGHYTFELQAANNEGLWNPQTATVKVTILPAWWSTWWFRLSVGALVILLVTGVYHVRVARIRKEEKRRNAFEKKLAQVEMMALRAQMNPHFLFNSLNSIDNYIIRNESRKASEYLNNFARLIRMILHHSRTNTIGLKDELDALDLYLQMEQLRFRDKFAYVIEVHPGVDAAAIQIPPMLIQPFVENAIWHGLMPKENGAVQKKVSLSVFRDRDDLCFVVEDNGIGRAAAQRRNDVRTATPRASMGLQITHERMDLIRKLYGLQTSVRIEDLKDGQGRPEGTRVEFRISLVTDRSGGQTTPFLSR